MTVWTTEAVREAAADWVWKPEGTRTAETDLQLIDYPDWTSAGMQARAIDSDRAPGQIIDSVRAQAQQWGRERVNWWITEQTRPSELEAVLVDQGALHDETVAVLARDLTSPHTSAPVSPRVTVERVETREQYIDVDVVNVAVWDQLPISPERLEGQLAEDASRGEFRVIGRLDGDPVCTAGCTVVDGVARLWGGATIEAARGNGVYHAVLDLRLRLARDAGAALALVKGRLETSAPILLRAGFSAHGEERIYAHNLS